MTQRTVKEMALLQTAIKDDRIQVWHKNQPADILTIPTKPTYFTKEIEVEVWDTVSLAQVMAPSINQWFQNQSNLDCQLVYMPDTAEHRMKKEYKMPCIAYAFAPLGATNANASYSTKSPSNSIRHYYLD